jgi:hypothetical protein
LTPLRERTVTGYVAVSYGLADVLELFA